MILISSKTGAVHYWRLRHVFGTHSNSLQALADITVALGNRTGTAYVSP